MGRLQDTGTKPVSMIAVLAVSLSTVIAMLDSTIANVALPLIAKDFSVSESASILIINAYQFAVIATSFLFQPWGERWVTRGSLWRVSFCLRCLHWGVPCRLP